MLARYTVTIAPTIAVINSVIAVAVTQFPHDNRAKVVWLVVVVTLGTVACGATIYSQHLTVTKEDAQKAHRKLVRVSLADFIATGGGLLAVARNPAQSFEGKAAIKWATSVELFLHGQLGDEYIVRFRDQSGLLHGTPAEIEIWRQNVWNGIYERMTRLHEFIREFSD